MPAVVTDGMIVVPLMVPRQGPLQEKNCLVQPAVQVAVVFDVGLGVVFGVTLGVLLGALLGCCAAAILKSESIAAAISSRVTIASRG